MDEEEGGFETAIFRSTSSGLWHLAWTLDSIKYHNQCSSEQNSWTTEEEYTEHTYMCVLWWGSVTVRRKMWRWLTHGTHFRSLIK